MATLAPRRRLRFTRLSNWVFQPRGPEAGEIVLNQRRVFIFPTRHGFFFAFSLLAFLAASINYDLALGFVLTFFLASAGLVAMLHTFRNQVHLALRPLRAEAVFAGSAAVFEVMLENRRDDERAAVWLRTAHAATVFDLPARSSRACATALPTTERGWLEAPRITLETRYPLGLFRAWSYWQPGLRCLVYPAPAGDDVLLPMAAEGSGEGVPRGSGTDDFGGLRQYLNTDSPRHIAWKAAAVALETGAALQAKHFLGTAAAEVVFDFDQLPAHLGREARLSQLTRRVLDADALGLIYTLRLGRQLLGPAHGAAQRLACLEALALFELPHAA